MAAGSGNFALGSGSFGVGQGEGDRFSLVLLLGQEPSGLGQFSDGLLDGVEAGA
jgi:hypothetical protein